MANDYTTSTDAFADISEGSYASSDYPAMASFVTAASRLIDREMGRQDGFFYPSTDTQTFYYDGSGDAYQIIDEFASITSVSVSEQGDISSTGYTSWTDGTDYTTRPYNASNLGKPINELVLIDYQGTKGSWYSFQKSVKVVGIPGYSTSVPDLVALAARVQSIRWFMRAKQAYQDEGVSVEMGALIFKAESELDKDIKEMLMPYKLELNR